MFHFEDEPACEAYKSCNKTQECFEGNLEKYDPQCCEIGTEWSNELKRCEGKVQMCTQTIR